MNNFSFVELVYIALFLCIAIASCMLTISNDTRSVEDSFMLECEIEKHTRTECKVMWREYTRE